MRRLLCLFLFLCTSTFIEGQSVERDTMKLNYISPIPWQPNTYVCQQPIDEIVIDGLDHEMSWKSTKWSDDFVDIEGISKSSPRHKTKVKMLWDKDYFYILTVLEEPHIWATLTKRDTVVYLDHAFEVFIDPDGDAHNYYEFQVNALNTIWDLFMLWPYREKLGPNYLTQWDAAGIKHAVHIEGSLNDATDTDSQWSVEMAIPWTAIQEMAPRRMAPRDSDQWRMNFARVDWQMEVVEGVYKKRLQNNGQPKPERYATWSPHGIPAMHMPEWWGYVQFSDSSVDEGIPAFKVKTSEEVKWALWQLYYQQKDVYEKMGRYGKDMESFTIPECKTCLFEPSLAANEFGYQFSAPSCDGKTVWLINETGKIWNVK